MLLLGRDDDETLIIDDPLLQIDEEGKKEGLWVYEERIEVDRIDEIDGTSCDTVGGCENDDANEIDMLGDADVDPDML